MNGSFPSSGFGPNGFGAGRPGSGGTGPAGAIWDVFDQLRDAFDKNFGAPLGTRMGKGDVRAAVLALLAEQPMHGYQIIRELEERTKGAWKPSPGSVYPTLQLLADEGLIEVQEAGGKKTYSLTPAGRAEAEASEGRSAPWESQGVRDSARSSALPKAGAKLAQAVGQVARGGTPEQVQQAVDVLDEARRRLYSILAQD